MNRGVSCVICCHNSAARLPETLRHLAIQVVSSELPWEVLVIDNNSTDDTAQVALKSWPKSAHAIIRVVSEPTPGLTNARLRAFASAAYEVITFIDDDNWVCEDWVQIVATIFAQQPEVAIVGGHNEATSDVPFPAWFKKHKRFYAVTDGHYPEGELTTTGRMLPGAGLSLRKSAVNKLLADGFTFTLAGRSGRAMSAGEDQELGLALQLAGWKIWYSPRLSLQHFMPAGRLTWPYLRRMLRGIGESSVLIDPYLFTLEERHGKPISERQRNWLWRALASYKEFLLARLKAVFAGENSVHVIQAERAYGRATMLLKSRGDYTKRFSDVANAPWVVSSP